MRTGVRIGIDVGKARVGVARSDESGSLAVPVETVPRSPEEAALRRIAELVADYDAIEIYVGLPLSLRGTATASTTDALSFASMVAARVPVPVRTVDERLSTVSAARSLHQAGRKARDHRGVIDQQAAVVIVQQALDTERSGAAAPGSALESLPERQADV